jgi:hypothetical protein
MSTVDQIFTLKKILEKCWEQNIDLHHLLTDFQAANGTVWRKEICSEMHKLCFPERKYLNCAEF